MHEIEHAIAGMERGDAAPTLVDDADAFMAENAARLQVGTSPFRM